MNREEPESQQRETSSTYLQIAFGGERSAADGAHERLLSGVCALMDLQGAGRREVLPADVAVVLLRHSPWGSRAEEGGRPQAAHGRVHRREVEAQWRLRRIGWIVGLVVTVHLSFNHASCQAGKILTCSGKGNGRGEFLKFKSSLTQVELWKEILKTLNSR